MTRITTLLLLVMFWSGAAFAAVYTCRDEDGNLFLTNNRNKFPPGCVQVGEPIGEESAPSPPAASPPAAQGREPEMIDRRGSSSPPRSQAPPAPREEAKPEAPSTETGAPAGEAEMTPAGSPETGPGGAKPGQSGEQPPPQEDQADERTNEVLPNAPGQTDQPNVDAPVEGGEMPAGEEAGATKEGELERWRAQARALADSNDALRTAARSQTGTAAQLEQLKNRIRLFLDRLAASKLTPEEQALVAAELPPQ